MLLLLSLDVLMIVKTKDVPVLVMQVLSGRGGIAPISFLTLALDGGEWSKSHPGCALPPGKGPPVPTG
jgi:hypothetical protein